MTLQRKQIYWVAGISALVALLAVWTFAIEWEWSFIGDDAAWIGKSREASSTWNPFDWISYWGSLVWTDTTQWGLFRPFYHLYGLVVAPLGADLAHGIRLLMFLVAVAAPLIVVWRNTQRGQIRLLSFSWIFAMLLSAYTMTYGIYFVSLQELTGITLVALGLISRNPLARGLFWLLAAWTKAPFIWLYLLFGISQLRSKYKKTSVLALSIGFITLGLMVWSALTGGYTDSRINLSPWHLWQSIQNLGTYGAAFFIVSLVGILIFANNLRIRTESSVLLGGAALYSLNLLPWNTIGYYNSPVWYLVICGLAAGIQTGIQSNQQAAYRWASPVLAVCLMGSLALFIETLRTDVFGRNTMVVEARDWVANESSRSSKIGLSYISKAELDFYVKEKYPGASPMLDHLPATWPDSGDAFDYVISVTDGGVPADSVGCPPIKVWTRGFLAPFKC